MTEADLPRSTAPNGAAMERIDHNPFQTILRVRADGESPNLGPLEPGPFLELGLAQGARP